jgi:hypothetical protein
MSTRTNSPGRLWRTKTTRPSSRRPTPPPVAGRSTRTGLERSGRDVLLTGQAY